MFDLSVLYTLINPKSLGFLFGMGIFYVFFKPWLDRYFDPDNW